MYTFTRLYDSVQEIHEYGNNYKEKLSRCWDSATCKPLDACCWNARLHVFPYCTGLPHSGSQDTTIRVGFGTQL